MNNEMKLRKRTLMKIYSDNILSDFAISYAIARFGITNSTQKEIDFEEKRVSQFEEEYYEMLVKNNKIDLPLELQRLGK